jgi:hypothetical protein
MSGVCQLADPCHLAEGPVARSPGARGNWAGAPGVISIGLGERLDHAQFRKADCAFDFARKILRADQARWPESVFSRRVSLEESVC